MPNKVYAFKHTKDVLLESSSGGAFTALAYLTLNNWGGVVYGACFDQNLKVVHQRAEKFSDCQKFRGSKYVQSNLGNTFQLIKEDLQNGKFVLFTGTPCQVKALKMFCLRQNISDDNLLSVDIICHGTMKPDIWEKFKNWIEKKYESKIQTVSFRYKWARWTSYPILFQFANGKKILNTFDARCFNRLFFSAVALNEGCYHCPFSNQDRVSDITIGDFWGIEKVMPMFPRDNGVSEVLVNTSKGQKFAKNMMEIPGTIMQECLSNEYLKYQHNLNSPTDKPRLADQFRQDIKSVPFEEILKRYADYTVKGFLMHCIRRLAGELHITNWLKKHLK